MPYCPLTHFQKYVHLSFLQCQSIRCHKSAFFPLAQCEVEFSVFVIPFFCMEPNWVQLKVSWLVLGMSIELKKGSVQFLAPELDPGSSSSGFLACPPFVLFTQTRVSKGFFGFLRYFFGFFLDLRIISIVSHYQY